MGSVINIIRKVGTVVAANLTNLKMAIVERFNNQLQGLQLGKEYKIDPLITEAIDLVNYLEDCNTPNTKYYKLIPIYCAKLKR